MAVKKSLFIWCLLFSAICNAQKSKPAPDVDTTFTDYDTLFDELDAFIDSITSPRSFTVFNLGLRSTVYNYESKTSYALEPVKKLLYTPSLSYFDKSGLGFNVEASVISEDGKFNPYQYAVSASYDYLKNRKFITGVALNHYFTKSSLSFYTSPLQNEANLYFTYKNFWIKPTVAVSYGWGSRAAYREREEYITSIQLAQRGYSRINTSETVNDLNITASARHDFYWLNLFSRKDYLRLTPQVSFVSGTQQFGFNQSTDTYATVRRTNAKVLYSSKNISLDNNLYFQPIALSGYLKTEYCTGKLFIQPQLILDYYFPAKDNNLTTSYVINVGIFF